MQRFFVILMFAAGCGGGLPGSECSRHKDTASCQADPACVVGSCPSCDGAYFQGCYAKDGPNVQGNMCPAVACAAPCSGHHDVAGCNSDPRCAVAGCPDCSGGTTFVSCYDRSTPPPVLTCPLYPCPAPCSVIKDETSCSVRHDCHAVYSDPGTCGCATAGCCAHFSGCASPTKADCTTTHLTCRVSPPFCEGDYVPSVTNGCWEGCVHQAECN